MSPGSARRGRELPSSTPRSEPPRRPSVRVPGRARPRSTRPGLRQGPPESCGLPSRKQTIGWPSSTPPAPRFLLGPRGGGSPLTPAPQEAALRPFPVEERGVRVPTKGKPKRVPPSGPGDGGSGPKSSGCSPGSCPTRAPAEHLEWGPPDQAATTGACELGKGTLGEGRADPSPGILGARRWTRSTAPDARSTPRPSESPRPLETLSPPRISAYWNQPWVAPGARAGVRG